MEVLIILSKEIVIKYFMLFTSAKNKKIGEPCESR